MSNKTPSKDDYISLIIGIDASNLRNGGGVTHLIELLRIADPFLHKFDHIIIWGGSETLNMLEEHSWLVKRDISDSYNGLIKRTFWQRFYFTQAAKDAGCNVLFVPGGSYIGNFSRVVTMSQNLLPFQMSELRRFGWTFFTLKLLLLRLVQSYTFRRANGVIFLTKYSQDAVLKITGMLNGKLSIIPHGINPRFENKPKKQLSISDYNDAKPFHIIYVSKVDQYKHQWHVIEAVASLRKLGLPVVLDLVGGSYMPALKRMKASINILDEKQYWVNYHGLIPFSELHHMYEKADLGVFASSCENMPNILLETMASGLPIACSKMGPMPEVLGEAGVYFDPEKSEDIFRALHYLIKSPLLRMKLAQDSYDLSRQYTWQRCTDETFKFLNEFKNEKRIIDV